MSSLAISTFVFYLEFGLYNPPCPQKAETRVKKFSKETSFHVGMELKKVQKQGRDENLNNPTPL